MILGVGGKNYFLFFLLNCWGHLLQNSGFATFIVKGGRKHKQYHWLHVARVICCLHQTQNIKSCFKNRGEKVLKFKKFLKLR